MTLDTMLEELCRCVRYSERDERDAHTISHKLGFDAARSTYESGIKWEEKAEHWRREIQQHFLTKIQDAQLYGRDNLR